MINKADLRKNRKGIEKKRDPRRGRTPYWRACLAPGAGYCAIHDAAIEIAPECGEARRRAREGSKRGTRIRKTAFSMARRSPPRAPGARESAKEGAVSARKRSLVPTGRVVGSPPSPTATTQATGGSGTAQGRARGARAAAVSTARVAASRESRAGRPRRRRSLEAPAARRFPRLPVEIWCGFYRRTRWVRGGSAETMRVAAGGTGCRR